MPALHSINRYWNGGLRRRALLTATAGHRQHGDNKNNPKHKAPKRFTRKDTPPPCLTDRPVGEPRILYRPGLMLSTRELFG